MALESKVMPGSVYLDLGAAIEKIIFTAKQIEVGDDPKVTEDDIKSLKTAAEQYKLLKPTDPIKKYPYSRISKALSRIQGYFEKIRIEYAIDALTEMCHIYRRNKRGKIKKIQLTKDKINEFGVQLAIYTHYMLTQRTEAECQLILSPLEEMFYELAQYVEQKPRTYVRDARHFKMAQQPHVITPEPRLVSTN